MTLTHLRALAEAATPGPWVSPTGDYVWAGEHENILIASSDEEGRSFAERRADMNYIAYMHPQRVLALIDVIEAAKAMRGDRLNKIGTFLMPCPYVNEVDAFDASIATLNAAMTP